MTPACLVLPLLLAVVPRNTVAFKLTSGRERRLEADVSACPAGHHLVDQALLSANSSDQVRALLRGDVRTSGLLLICEACPAGTWQSGTDSDLPCLPKASCGEGTFFVDNSLVEKSCEVCPEFTEQPLTLHLETECALRTTCAPGTSMTWPRAVVESTSQGCRGCRKSFATGSFQFCDDSYEENAVQNCGRTGCPFAIPQPSISPALCEFHCALEPECTYFSVYGNGECNLHLVTNC
jgi:hypothetical protein